MIMVRPAACAWSWPTGKTITQYVTQLSANNAISSYGKSITAQGWTRAEVAPIQDLDDKWRSTLASITELAGDNIGAPTLARARATYLDSPDDSGLLTEEEPAMQQEEEEVDQENIPPTSSPSYANNRRPGLRH